MVRRTAISAVFLLLSSKNETKTKSQTSEKLVVNSFYLAVSPLYSMLFWFALFLVSELMLPVDDQTVSSSPF